MVNDRFSPIWLLRDDGLTYRGQCQAGRLEVLNAKRDANDGDEPGKRGHQVPDCEPDAHEYELQDTAKRPECPGTNVLVATQYFPTHYLFAERKEGELT